MVRRVAAYRDDLPPFAQSRTKDRSIGAPLSGRTWTLSVRASLGCTLMVPIGAAEPAFDIRNTNESPVMRPLPSHAVPEKVMRATTPHVSLSLEEKDKRTNRNDGVTERHAPANVSGVVESGTTKPEPHLITVHAATVVTTRSMRSPCSRL